MSRLHYFTLAAGLLFSLSVSAQEQSTTASSTSSARPIPESDIMYKKTVWRTMDLREKQNKPMFSQGRTITKIIMDAVMRGELQAYANDSLTTPLTLDEFKEKLNDPAAGAPASTETEPEDDWDIPAAGGSQQAAAAPAGPTNTMFFPHSLYLIEMREDVIFDKKRSRMYNDIKALTIVIPSTLSAAQIEQPAASFKYNDLVRVFRNNPETAIWFNAQNDAQHKNLADAFDLRLFSSYITKISNPGDKRLEDIYGVGLQSILAAQRAAEEMIEYEYNLWSY
jgi:gliding motility associated protien GldN